MSLIIHMFKSCLKVLLLVILVFNTCMSSYAINVDTASTSTNKSLVTLYQQLDFSGMDQLRYAVFKHAYAGYMKLLSEKKLRNSGLLTVCDYTLSSNKNRLWLIDLKNKRVLLNTYVAHGQGTGEEYARHFSNKEGSHQSSLGFYVTGDTYTGKHGYTLYLHGMDKGYNSAAYERLIVMHGAAYVSDDFIAGTGRLGRSWGCPAVSIDVAEKLIDKIKGGSCLYIFYPDAEYLKNSHWLNGM